MKLFKSKSRRIDPNKVVLTQQQVKDIEEARRFYNQLSQWPLVTGILLAVILAFWLLSVILGAEQSPATLVRMGAKINFLIDHGQAWRLVSPIFLHFGILHILFNGYALYLLGRMIENLYGHRRFLILFFISGTASIAASYAATEHMSVGASGAIFGLLGAGAVVGIKHREQIPPIFRRYFGKGLIPWIVLNLALGLIIDGIDNTAHVGGLVAGVLTVMAMNARIGERREGWLTQIGLTTGAIAAVAIMVLVIINMVHNMVVSDSLPLPERWVKVSDEPSRMSAQIPSILSPVDNQDIGYGKQFIERQLGFWLALEREPEKHIDLDKLSDDLYREIGETKSIDLDSVQILADEMQFLAGRPARKIHLRFKLIDQPMEYELEVWMAPSPMGMLNATCSAPRMFYPSFKSWCAAFIDSVRVIE